jgi:hypothetical protein
MVQTHDKCSPFLLRRSLNPLMAGERDGWITPWDAELDLLRAAVLNLLRQLTIRRAPDSLGPQF